MEPIYVFLLILFAIPAVLYLLTIICGQADSFAQTTFPRISDEEFLTRCKPGTNPAAVALKVRAIVAEQLSIEEARIYPEHRFIEDLRAD